MGLYLCIFDGDEELDGVEVGIYGDFGHFREAVTRLEHGRAGSRFPTLILHSDCDGEWTVAECVNLEKELELIAAEFMSMPPSGFNSDWQKEEARLLGLHSQNLYESFIDVDGEPLIERLIGLCQLAQRSGRPITFQ